MYALIFYARIIYLHSCSQTAAALYREKMTMGECAVSEKSKKMDLCHGEQLFTT